MPRHNPHRRRELADAAIALLAAEGIHGLTHRAVDRATALPSGTASNYFRSRDELLVAAAERVVDLHLADMARIDDATDVAASAEPLVDAIAASLLDAVGPSRERYLAIFELQLEARRRPHLATALAGLEGSSLAATAQEHAALGLDTAPETIANLVVLYSGALFCLVSAPHPPDAATVRHLARSIVHGAAATPTPGGHRDDGSVPVPPTRGSEDPPKK